jgi:hypothetical protein
MFIVYTLFVFFPILKEHFVLNKLRKGIFLIFVIVTPVVTLLSYQVYSNKKHNGTTSILTSDIGPWNFYVGTSKAHAGTYNQEDKALCDSLGLKVMTKMAIDRIMVDPIDYVRFAFSDKVKSLWNTDTYPLYCYIQIVSFDQNKLKQSVFQVISILIDPLYYICLILFFIYLTYVLINGFNLIDKIFVVSFIPILLLHVFVEVSSRYHNPMMPAIYFGAIISMTVILPEQLKRFLQSPKTISEAQ